MKKVPTLKGKTVILFFVENSTRTKTSFDVAAKRLSADTFSLAKSGSSLNKGESLKDTALTLQAMSPDIIVIRHSSSGAAEYIANLLPCSIVNGGDGWHAHPTQSLLDAYALRSVWGSDFSGKTLLILGDIEHSRVARSNIFLLQLLGAKVRLCGPRTLIPRQTDFWGCEVCSDLDKAVEGVDAIMCLRLQLERQEAGLLPMLSEYSKRYCLTSDRLMKANKGAVVLHPGPMNRGWEIASDVADSEQCLVLDQVSAGVAVRMAVLYLLGGPEDIAYENGMDDFNRINHVMAVAVNYPVGHGGTYRQPHGGEFSVVALAWLDWMLKGDRSASRMFIGRPAGILERDGWTIETNMERLRRR